MEVWVLTYDKDDKNGLRGVRHCYEVYHGTERPTEDTLDLIRRLRDVTNLQVVRVRTKREPRVYKVEFWDHEVRYIQTQNASELTWMLDGELFTHQSVREDMFEVYGDIVIRIWDENGHLVYDDTDGARAQIDAILRSF